MPFQFNLKQRVNVPDRDGTQGVIDARMDSTHHDNSYHLEYLSGGALGQSGWFTEGALSTANYAPAAKPKR